MHLKLDYGNEGVWVEIPDKNLAKVITMKKCQPLQNPIAAVKMALEKPIDSLPLEELARNKSNACIVICDITRPVPNKILLPPVLTTLDKSGITRENITILIATGIHRPCTPEEIRYLVGDEIQQHYRIVNHDARRPETHAFLGRTANGTAVFIDSIYIHSDLKITTGYIEPHLMAGFSGGRKLICPGIASLDTVKVLHGPKILEHPNSREGVIKGNPFHEEALEIAQMAGVDFIVNVALDENKAIRAIFAGNLVSAHEEGIEFVKKHSRDTIAEPVDIVVTTAGGYPLDATFYQAIKGLTAALSIVKKNGIIILAAQCREGLGSTEFSRLIREMKDPEEFMRRICGNNYFIIDQWQVEEFIKVLRKVEVLLYCEGIAVEDQGRIFVTPIRSVAEGIKMAIKKHGDQAKIAVIPQGPYLLAELE